MSEMDTWMGLSVSHSPYLPQGTFIWRKGTEVVGIVTGDRSKFFGLFGLAALPPDGADNLVISPDDYLLTMEEIAALK